MAIVVEAQLNRQPIMTEEMEPSALNVTLSLWGLAQCLACWWNCLEPRQADGDRKRKSEVGELDGRTEKISKRVTMCMHVLVSVDVSMSCLLPSPKSPCASNS